MRGRVTHTYSLPIIPEKCAKRQFLTQSSERLFYAARPRESPSRGVRGPDARRYSC
jgi:hypothetical protein